MDLVLFKEIYRDDPRTWTKYLVDPFTVLEYLRSFLLVHDDLTLLLNGFLVATDANNEMSILE